MSVALKPEDYCMQMATTWVSPPLQEHEELVRFLDFLKRETVTSYLEVGVRYGGTFEAVMMRRPPGSRGVALDFPGGDFGADNSIEFMLGALRRLKRHGYDVSHILGPSSAPEVVMRAAQKGPYDCVFLDADHSYAAIKRDFALYSPMGKMIAIHDIAAPEGFKSRRGTLVDVARFWREIKDKYRSHEIIVPGSNMGIGIVWTD